MSEDLKQTVRILVQKKVALDDRGRTVWVAPIETAEFELVSTATLKQMLASDNDEHKRQLKALATEKDGVLAQSVEDGSFCIVEDTDLHEELSLVSTVALRRILKHEDAAANIGEPDEDRGFNPYDKS